MAMLPKVMSEGPTSNHLIPSLTRERVEVRVGIRGRASATLSSSTYTVFHFIAARDAYTKAYDLVLNYE